MRLKLSFHILSVLALASLFASCGHQVTGTRETIPYVSSLLIDKNSHEMSLLKGLGAPSPAGDIFIIGSEPVCADFAEFFSSIDKRDNVDGSIGSDLLPDYCGETLDCVTDSFGLSDSPELARERAVRKVLASMDTTVHISPYDIDGMGRKNLAKVIILADPFVAQNGAFDVDTLFRSTGCTIPVIVPLDAMIRKVFRQSPDRNLSVGVIYGTHYKDETPFVSRFNELAAESGHGDSECFVYRNERKDSLFHYFLTEYSKVNQGRPLDALIVDDVNIDLDMLKLELAETLSVLHESSMTLGRLISKDFLLFEAKTEVEEACYRILRERNLFTHNISYPRVEEYKAHLKPRSDDGSIILIHADYVQN